MNILSQNQTNVTYSDEHRNNNVDEFLTPPELIARCFNEMLSLYMWEPYEELVILDPGANKGQWGTQFRKYFPKAYIIGVEIMEGLSKPAAYDEWHTCNFLDWQYDGKIDVVAGNPPYSNKLDDGPKTTVAEDFVWKARSLLDDSGILAYLLRSNFRHSRERYWKDRAKRTEPGLHQAWHFKYDYAVTPRPSFYKYDMREEAHGTSRTNAHDYSLFIWEMAWKEKYGYAKELDWEYFDPSRNGVSPFRLSV